MSLSNSEQDLEIYIFYITLIWAEIFQSLIQVKDFI